MQIFKSKMNDCNEKHSSVAVARLITLAKLFGRIKIGQKKNPKIYQSKQKQSLNIYPAQY